MVEHGVVELVQSGQEFADVVGAARAQPLKIDAGGKDFALPREHHRLGIGLAQLQKARGQRLAKFDVERIGLAVHQRQHGNSVIDFDVDHTPCSAG
jgi:hypothetical protein